MVKSVLRALAHAFLAGELDAEQIVARAGHTLGKPCPWLGPLASRYVEAVGGHTRPRLREVVRFLREDQVLARALQRHRHTLTVAEWLHEPQRMQPAAAAASWEVPVIESAGALANWLGLLPTELDWFADLKRLGFRQGEAHFRHYYYRVVSKPAGGFRLIEAPKTRLRRIQRQILAEILEKVPMHPAVHGFVKGRSIKTFAAPHVGRRVVLRMDLQDFFPSFSSARIQAFVRTMGYPEPVADLLGGICTTVTPRDIWENAGRWDERELYTRPHLPQGAPTSPMLSNLCSFRMDCRLAGLARTIGAEYSRYADDLAFSGDDEAARSLERLPPYVAAIVAEEGFSVNHRKTRIMRQGVRQHLAGLVTNKRINVARVDFDRLKAVLTNCVRHGPESQNREGHREFRAHLEGRVSFVEMVNPAKGSRLRSIFSKIEWPERAQ